MAHPGVLIAELCPQSCHLCVNCAAMGVGTAEYADEPGISEGKEVSDHYDRLSMAVLLHGLTLDGFGERKRMAFKTVFANVLGDAIEALDRITLRVISQAEDIGTDADIGDHTSVGKDGADGADEAGAAGGGEQSRRKQRQRCS